MTSHGRQLIHLTITIPPVPAAVKLSLQLLQFQSMMIDDLTSSLFKARSTFAFSLHSAITLGTGLASPPVSTAFLTATEQVL